VGGGGTVACSATLARIATPRLGLLARTDRLQAWAQDHRSNVLRLSMCMCVQWGGGGGGHCIKFGLLHLELLCEIIRILLQRCVLAGECSQAATQGEG